ncbi:MAG: ABC-F family ATP-binding cassette domain-containing protein [Chthonomonas sp.]|nr:ABC-F family ATP-binding cassette domain-containing protein [Chthonomonas sp.]
MLLAVADLRKEFATEIVFEAVNLRVNYGEKLAIVGRNGAGKTTFLRILCGEYEPDGGSVNLGRGVTVGYLSQHSNLPEDRTVLQEAQAAQDHLRDLELRLAELEGRADSLSADELEEMSMLREHFIAEGGYNLDRDVRSVLARLGFQEPDYDKPIAKLSGGERTRLSLAKLLLEEPELLILDEPTNHLDLEATEWLEGWVRQYHGAILLVSHDRKFLEATAERVMDFRDQGAKVYPAKFTHYLTLRAEEDERQATLAARQAAEIDRMEEYVRRFMNSQRTAQARGRLKQVTKLKAQAVSAPSAEKGIHFNFSPTKRAGDIVLETKGLGMAFPGRTLFQNLDWLVMNGERWGVIGQNGVGKSTLIKCLLGQMPPSSGSYRIGASVEVGYFAQELVDLDLTQTALAALINRTGLEIGPARNHLGRFLFTGDDCIRPIKTLSGGERNKLQLAILMAMRPNVLVLDEPTNHLDMPSREALIEVLQEFTGTLLLVSHDRWLLERVTTNTLDLRRDGNTIYPGSYPEYRAFRDRASAPSPVKKAAVIEVAKPASTMTPRELSKEIGRLEKAVSAAESDVERAETALQKASAAMVSAGPDADHLALSMAYADQESKLASAMSTWESVSLELEERRAEQG